MKIVPVIDLKDSVVVRGVAGQRELYRPVKSVLECDATPKSVADAFARHFGFQSVYVADLDAIAGAEPNWAAYREITSAGLRVSVDAGINCLERVSRFIDDSPDCGWCCGVVVGLESLRRESDLTAICAAIGPERAVFSLDLRNGKPLTTISAWRESEPIEMVDEAVNAGFERLIVLDLASVGVGEGVSVLRLCSAIRKRYPHVEITAGGGVRSRSDLTALVCVGCNVGLVASALHSGDLSKEDIAHFG